MYQEVGDIRSIAVTQNAMANVLRQQGKPQEALALYQESLHTAKELGDVRGVAVTQGAMAGCLEPARQAARGSGPLSGVLTCVSRSR